MLNVETHNLSSSTAVDPPSNQLEHLRPGIGEYHKLY